MDLRYLYDLAVSTIKAYSMEYRDKGYVFGSRWFK